MAPQDSNTGIAQYDAADLQGRIAAGSLTVTELAELCLARIKTREKEINAWAWHDADFARQQAKALDGIRVSGKPLGPLHGLPVGIKDVIDTARIPTANGTATDKTRVPTADAFVVERLKSAGALIMGKTATAELAYIHPPATRNPHNPAHTPGGSSSGSAAAVADGHVPLAIGTQTIGSVLRPASYCGIVGFKPGHGEIPRRGILTQSPPLDTVGVFATTIPGAALLAECLFGYDAADSATRPAPHPQLLKTALEAVPVPPTFAVIKPPGWERATPDMVAAIGELTGVLGEQAFEVELPDVFADAPELARRLQIAGMARYFHRYDADNLGGETREAIMEGQKVTAADYLAALDWPDVLRSALDEIFDRCDAILLPAATGPAPEGLSGTGDSIFNGLATLTGLPAISLPLFTASGGMPMGCQLIGARYNDGRLLRTARWLTQKITG